MLFHLPSLKYKAAYWCSCGVDCDIFKYRAQETDLPIVPKLAARSGAS